MKKDGNKEPGRQHLVELNFLVAEFMEVGQGALGKRIRGNPEKARQVLERLHRILFSNRPVAYDSDDKDLEGVDFKEVVLLYHFWLKDTWNVIRDKIFHYKESILPMADEVREAKKVWGATISGSADVSKPGEDGDNLDSVDEFAELALSSLPTPEFYEDHVEQLPMPALEIEKSDQPDKKQPVIPMVNIVFDGKNLKFTDRLNPIDALLDALDGLPISIFRKCQECGRCFIQTKAGKAYCTHLCAANAGQRKRWREDPQGAREKDRARYQKRRKSTEVAGFKGEEG